MKAGVKLGLLHMGVAAALLFGGMSAAGASETGGTAGPGNSQASSQLVGVSCASTKFCVAVGYRTTTFFDDRPKPFMEMYDGNSWRLRWAPLSAMETGGLLVSVSCPTPDFCAAVGSQTRLGESRSLIEVWNGRTWAVDDASGVPWDSFVSVSCSSGHFCMAVGSGPYGPRIGNTETIAWNGRYWRKVPSPNPPGYLSVSFTGVSCTAGNFCEAVGQTLTEHDAPFAMAAGYDGHRWTMQPLPHVAGVLSYLLSVSCVSRSDCRSVGGVEPNDLIDKPYGLIYDGSRWTNDDPGVMSYNGFGSGLNGVSCVSARTCVSVGNYGTSNFLARSYSEISNGYPWTAHFPVEFASGTPQLSDVSCVSTRFCVTVGSLWNATVTSARVMAQTWDGSRFSLDELPSV